MNKIYTLILGCLLVSGCVSDGGTTLPLSVEGRAVRQMAGTISILKKQRIAAIGCEDAGYLVGTPANRRCMSALIARDLKHIRERADRLIREAARRHGLCLDRKTFEIGRCLEI